MNSNSTKIKTEGNNFPSRLFSNGRTKVLSPTPIKKNAIYSCQIEERPKSAAIERFVIPFSLESVKTNL